MRVSRVDWCILYRRKKMQRKARIHKETLNKFARGNLYKKNNGREKERYMHTYKGRKIKKEKTKRKFG